MNKNLAVELAIVTAVGFGFAQANSTTGAAGEKSCDAVSNVNNTLVILKTCGSLEGAPRAECFQTFRERK